MRKRLSNDMPATAAADRRNVPVAASRPRATRGTIVVAAQQSPSRATGSGATGSRARAGIRRALVGAGAATLARANADTADTADTAGKEAEHANARWLIWQAVAAIPPGHVATYGQVAEMAGLPRRARLVGRVLSQLPGDTTLPWHRVVNAAGRIMTRPSGGDRVQRQRLLTEGVGVRDARVDLRRARWRPA